MNTSWNCWRVVAGAVIGCTALVPTPGNAAAGNAATNGAAHSTAAHAEAKNSAGGQSVFVAPAAPQSVFAVPRNREQGKDPFYPRSTLVYGEDLTTKTTNAPTPVAEFFLRGISGTDDNPLAIINNVTFGVGDELEVSTKAGKMKIRCLKINKEAGTATVQMGGLIRELRLNAPTQLTPAGK